MMSETWQRVLVTGCTGYLGRNLVRLLRSQVAPGGLFGTSRRAANTETQALVDEHAAVDLRSLEETRELVARARPDVVFHLASQRAGTLTELLTSNVVATDNLLRSLRELYADARVVVVGSSAEVGFCRPEELPITEDATCRPVDDYGVSKLAQSALAQTANLAHGQPVLRVRLFNLIGPGVPDALLPGRCANLLASTRTTEGVITLSFGNLDTQRDYTDVRDAARAIMLAAERGVPGSLYHIGNGRGVSGRELVETLAAEAGVKVEFDTDEQLQAHAGVPVQVADASLAARELSWSPEISFHRSIKDTWLAANTRPQAAMSVEAIHPR